MLNKNCLANKDERCSSRMGGRSLCDNHYHRMKRAGRLEKFPVVSKKQQSVCKVEECTTNARSLTSEYCEKHYYRLRRAGTLDITLREYTGYCLQCNVAVEKAPSGNRLFCSVRCQARNSRDRDESDIYCKQCGCAIPSTRRKGTIFCTKKCNRIWKYANDSEYRQSVLINAANQSAIRKRKALGRFTKEQWNHVLNFYGNKCLDCGTEDNITKDHVIPIKMGGMNTYDNLQPLCLTCNIRKHAKHIDFRPDLGIDMVKTFANPA